MATCKNVVYFCLRLTSQAFANQNFEVILKLHNYFPPKFQNCFEHYFSSPFIGLNFFRNKFLINVRWIRREDESEFCCSFISKSDNVFFHLITSCQRSWNLNFDSFFRFDNLILRQNSFLNLCLPELYLKDHPDNWHVFKLFFL